MREEIRGREQVLGQVEQLIASAEDAVGQPEGKQAMISVLGNVTNSSLVIGHDNRHNQKQYILPKEPKAPLFVGVPPMPTHFVGREPLVEKLVRQLVAGRSLSLSAEGLPGVGKTALAVALTHQEAVPAHFCDGVLWAGLGQKADVLAVLARWGEALGCDVTHLASEMERSQAVKDAIGQRRLLLVIDDVWDVEAARWLRVGGPNSCHLLTTRDKSIAETFAKQVQTVPVLPEAPAFELLQELAPSACAADYAKARQLAQVVGGLPLALSLLGGYLASPKRSYFPELAVEALEEMHSPKRRLELASQRLGGARQVTLQEVIELSLADLPNEVVAAFYALGAFACKPASFEHLAACAVTEANLRPLALLIARNLLEQAGDKRLALHQVLADVARTQTKTDTIVRHRDYYLAQVNHNQEDWQRIEAIYEQIQWAWTKLPANQIVIDYVAALRIYQERRGLWREQLTWTERGVKIAQASQKRQIEGTLLNNIGVIYDNLGKKDKALAYHQRALLIRQELGDRAGLAMTLNNIGLLYDSLGQSQKAEGYHKQALPMRKEVGDWSGLATTLNNIAQAFQRQGLSQKALEHYQQALDIWQKIEDKTAIAKVLNNIGHLYDNLGQIDTALEYYQRALPIREEMGDRAGLARTLNNIAQIYLHFEQTEEALAYCQRALSICDEIGDKAALATMLNSLGTILSDLGEFNEALNDYQRALSMREEVGDRRGQAITLANMGAIYYEEKRWQKGLSYLRRALRIQQQIGDKAKESSTRYHLGLTYHKLGKQAKAVAELKKAVELATLRKLPELEQYKAKLTEFEMQLALQQELKKRQKLSRQMRGKRRKRRKK